MVKINSRYIILFLISCFFFFLIGGEVFNGIFYINLILFIIAVIYIILVKLFLDIQVDYKEQDYYVGDLLIINIIVNNRTFFPFPYVYICSKSINKVMYVQPYKNIIIEKKIKLDQRGIYDIENFTVQIKDIFNIFTTNKVVINDKKVRVYPKIYSIEEVLCKIKSLNKKEFSSLLMKLDEETIVRDVRKYEIGDSLKKVHWKLSAKYGELLVKNFEKRENKEIDILLYLSNLKNEKNKAMDEEMVSFFVSLVNYIQCKGFNIKLYINSKENKFIKIINRQDFKELLEYFLGDQYYFGLNFYEFIEENLNTLKSPIVFYLDKEENEYTIQKLEGVYKNVQFINYNELTQGEIYEKI